MLKDDTENKSKRKTIEPRSGSGGRGAGAPQGKARGSGGKRAGAPPGYTRRTIPCELTHSLNRGAAAAGAAAAPTCGRRRRRRWCLAATGVAKQSIRLGNQWSWQPDLGNQLRRSELVSGSSLSSDAFDSILQAARHDPWRCDTCRLGHCRRPARQAGRHHPPDSTLLC